MAEDQKMATEDVVGYWLYDEGRLVCAQCYSYLNSSEDGSDAIALTSGTEVDYIPLCSECGNAIKDLVLSEETIRSILGVFTLSVVHPKKGEVLYFLDPETLRKIRFVYGDDIANQIERRATELGYIINRNGNRRNEEEEERLPEMIASLKRLLAKTRHSQ